MKCKKYTKEMVEKFILECSSYRMLLFKLGLKEAGGNYSTIKNYIKKHSLDISHFTHKAWSRGKKIGIKYKIEDYLNNQRSIQSHKFKNRLIKEGYFERKCYNCNNTHWLDQPIPIELEHIDGNHSNNNLNNLTILCPNCHAQTPTYRGKNIKKA